MAATCPMCDAPLCPTCGGCDDECSTCECYDSTDTLGLEEILDETEEEAETE